MMGPSQETEERMQREQDIKILRYVHAGLPIPEHLLPIPYTEGSWEQQSSEMMLKDIQDQMNEIMYSDEGRNMELSTEAARRRIEELETKLAAAEAKAGKYDWIKQILDYQDGKVDELLTGDAHV